MNCFFYVILNDSNKKSWDYYLWNDDKKSARILFNTQNFHSKLFSTLYKAHFSNKLNNRIWLPFKSIWNMKSCIRESDLSKIHTNYLIFQGNVKVSPILIGKYKKKYNTIVVLYLLDTVSKLGIANDIKGFKRYLKYYKIDYVFSFDQGDCNKFGIQYFDIYSRNSTFNFRRIDIDLPVVLYVGNCRSKERLKLLHQIFCVLRGKCKCNFYITGVEEKDKLYPEEIQYNSYMEYGDVLKQIEESDVILELVNNEQFGNTLRCKEAIVYNRRLITSNPMVKKSRYYNTDAFFILEDNWEEHITRWISKISKGVEHGYAGEFEPSTFYKLLSEECSGGKKR